MSTKQPRCHAKLTEAPLDSFLAGVPGVLRKRMATVL